MRRAGKAHHQWRVQPGGHVQHHHQVHAGVHLGVVRGGWGTPTGAPLRAAAPAAPALAQHLEHARGLCFHQAARQFTHTRSGQVVHLAVLHHLAHQLHGFRGHGEVGKTRRKAGHAQDAHRVFAEQVGHVPRSSRACRSCTPWYGSNSTVAPVESALLAMELIVRSRREVFFQCDVGRALHHKAPVAPPALALGAGQRIPRAFRGAETPENRGPRANSPVPASARAWHPPPPVVVIDGAAQKAVTHRAANHVNLHGAGL